MGRHDEAEEQIKAGVSCAAVLEALGPGWTLDRRKAPGAAASTAAAPAAS